MHHQQGLVVPTRLPPTLEPVESASRRRRGWYCCDWVTGIAAIRLRLGFSETRKLANNTCQLCTAPDADACAVSTLCVLACR